MADNVSGLPDRGKTYHDGRTPPTTFQESVRLEGYVRCVVDDQDTPGTGANTRRSGRKLTQRLVRNVSTIALEPKRLVKWAAGFRGQRVDGYTFTADEEVAGVVDEFYGSGGIPVNDLGWITICGPALVKSDTAVGANNVIAEGDILTAKAGTTAVSADSGRIKPNTLGGLTDQIVLNRFGRSQVANLSTQTDNDILVDMENLLES